MSLRLNVPVIDDKPAAPAETRPKLIQGMIASLPLSNPRATARLLLDELERINRQPCAVEVRLTALELYRPAIFSTVEGLSRQYCNQPLPLQETAKAQAELTQQLFTELAIGYKLAILAEEDRLFTIGDDNQLALLLQRAMDALGRLLRLHHLTYAQQPAGIWAELHLLYLHSLQRALQDMAVPDNNADSSINIIYKHALLLAMAGPSHLNSIDIERVIDYLDRHANLAQLHPLFNPEKPTGVFLVRLRSDAPPIPLTKNTQDADPKTDVLLITIELARQVHAHITQLQAGDRQTISGLPDNAAADQRYRDLLLHLLKQWGNPPKRVFQRSKKVSAIQMCVGLPAVHHFLRLESAKTTEAPVDDDSAVTVNFADSPIDSGGGAIFKCAHWLIVDESPGGFALSKPAPAQESLRIGELLGLKPDQSGQWGLAVVRWATNGDNGPLKIGAQMLAPTAESALLHISEFPNAEPALLLPEIAFLKQVATLVSTRGVHKPARTMQLEVNGRKTDIMLTRLVERTNNFERFQFSTL